MVLTDISLLLFLFSFSYPPLVYFSLVIKELRITKVSLLWDILEQIVHMACIGPRTEWMIVWIFRPLHHCPHVLRIILHVPTLSSLPVVSEYQAEIFEAEGACRYLFTTSHTMHHRSDSGSFCFESSSFGWMTETDFTENYEHIMDTW